MTWGKSDVFVSVIATRGRHSVLTLQTEYQWIEITLFIKLCTFWWLKCLKAKSVKTEKLLTVERPEKHLYNIIKCKYIQNIFFWNAQSILWVFAVPEEFWLKDGWGNIWLKVWATHLQTDGLTHRKTAF